MILNRGKFQAIIIVFGKQGHTNEIFTISSKEIKIASQVIYLREEIDNVN